ncbi:phage structural protein, partial [Candidatus Glomeribacter gigasporarum]|uniref:phage structural protein n=1 Tax=Candidatus Glomeribacter gigasporarum TaxID=132144 RepID=UPI0005B2EA2A
GAGVAEEGITLAREGDQGKLVVGADGEFMHVLNADKSGTVTVRLLKTSPVNAQLMGLYDTQAADSRLYGQNVITVHQTQSGDTIVCRGCAFKKMPDLSYKKDDEPVEWVFAAGKIDAILGNYT